MAPLNTDSPIFPLSPTHPTSGIYQCTLWLNEFHYSGYLDKWNPCCCHCHWHCRISPHPSCPSFWGCLHRSRETFSFLSNVKSTEVNVPCTPGIQSPRVGAAWPTVTHGSEVLQAARETTWLGISFISFLQFWFCLQALLDICMSCLAYGLCDHQAWNWAELQRGCVLSCRSGCTDTMPGLWRTTGPRGAAGLRDCCWPIWWTGPIAETPPWRFSTQPKIPRHRMHPLFMFQLGRWEGLHALLKQ